MDLGLTVEVNDRKLTEHLDKLPDLLKQALRPKITALTQELLQEVHAAEPRRTGRLISLTQSFVDERQDYIRGRVRVLGTPQERHNIAAGALEYGVRRGEVSVAASRREGIPVSAYQRRDIITARRFLRGPFGTIWERAMADIREAIAAALHQS
jgi:hypothetical protein